MKQILKEIPPFNIIWLGMITLFAVIIGVLSFTYVDLTFFSIDTLIYMLCLTCVLIVFGGIGVKRIIKEKEKNYKIRIFVFIFLLVLALFVAVWFSDYLSYDYDIYLSEWINEYKALSFRDALLNITNISNYTPVYNYFLIFIVKLNINPLYSVKFITFVFSLLLGLSMELVVCHIKKTKFNYCRSVVFLLIPTVCMEYSFWGQCDAIYVSFCVLAFYFALKKKSKLSFVFVGLAFAFKLQFLFIVPILFVMLIIKDENGEHYLKWKDIWLAPLMYVVNLLPVFVGASIWDLLLVYFVQTTYYSTISQNCANFCYIFEIMQIYVENRNVYISLISIFTILTISILIFLVVRIIKLNKSKSLSPLDLLFFATLFSFIMVFFMPKMLDRFYFLSVVLAIMLVFSKLDLSNFYIALLLESSLFFVMYSQFSWTEDWILSSWGFMMILALILNFIVLVVFAVRFFKTYKLKTKENQPIKNENVETISNET